MTFQGLIAIDLDGTLLDVNGHYSSATRDYLRQLTPRGYGVVLATGRPYRAVKAIYEDLGIHAPVICYNGALVFHPDEPDFPALEAKFSQDEVIDIYRNTRDIVIHFMAESSTHVYIDEEDERLRRYFPYEGMELSQGNFAKTLKEDVFTLLFRSDKNEELGARIEGRYENIAWRGWSGGSYSELFVPSAHKGTALTYLMDFYGLSQDKVFAFGDASNDVEMLRVSGHPFAMKGNRTPHLLSIFPQTKNPVEEDGVMLTLQELLG